MKWATTKHGKEKRNARTQCVSVGTKRGPAENVVNKITKSFFACCCYWHCVHALCTTNTYFNILRERSCRSLSLSIYGILRFMRCCLPFPLLTNTDDTCLSSCICSTLSFSFSYFYCTSEALILHLGTILQHYTRQRSAISFSPLSCELVTLFADTVLHSL